MKLEDNIRHQQNRTSHSEKKIASRKYCDYCGEASHREDICPHKNYESASEENEESSEADI